MQELSKETAAKLERLNQILNAYGSCAVAFSGGLDSTVLAKAAQLVLGENAIAVTGVSASLAAGELTECHELATQIGIRHEVLQTDELSNPEYQANTGNRCYYCKTELFVQVEKLSKRLGVAVVADGSNWDDRSDHRPGMQAAREQQVSSPLAEAGLTKTEIRELARYWGLPIWDKPATPCLSSRIAYGETVTPEKLAMIDRGERFLRARGFEPVRVRYHRGDVARIEVSLSDVPRLVEPELREELLDELQRAGFKFVSVDLAGFRSGSLNQMLPASSLQILDG